MKLLLLFMFPVSLFAQANPFPTDSVTGKVVYTDVVKVDSANKDDLYQRGKEWFVTEFKDAQEVLQLDDKGLGKIIGKGNAKVYFTCNMLDQSQVITARLNFTITLSVKDGRYKYSFSDISFGEGFPIEDYNTTVYDREKYKQNYKEYAGILSEKKIDESITDQIACDKSRTKSIRDEMYSIVQSLTDAMSTPTDSGGW